MKNTVIHVRLPAFLQTHCNKRINELGEYHDMDMSKFIRWLIRADYQRCQNAKKAK